MRKFHKEILLRLILVIVENISKIEPNQIGKAIFALNYRGCQIFCVNEYSHLQSGHPISVEDSKLI
jgi:hypothetical protein